MLMMLLNLSPIRNWKQCYLHESMIASHPFQRRSSKKHILKYSKRLDKGKYRRINPKFITIRQGRNRFLYLNKSTCIVNTQCEIVSRSPKSFSSYRRLALYISKCTLRDLSFNMNLLYSGTENKKNPKKS